jgi:hypothetical protein
MSSHDVEGEQVEIRWRKPESESVAIDLPKTAIASLEKVAQNKDMSVNALLKFYIGRGLRQDLSDLSANQLLDAVAEVLSERLGSQADADAVMREIRQKSAQIVMPAMTVASAVADDRSVRH